MATGDHHRKLERMYLKAPINAYFRPSIHIRDGEADIVIPVQPEFFHAAHAVHGSVYFKAMDDAAFFAVNSIVEDVFVLTASFNLHLLRPISAGAAASSRPGPARSCAAASRSGPRWDTSRSSRMLNAEC